MNSSHQTPFMDKSIPEWLLKNPQFMEQLKREKQLKEKHEQVEEHAEPSSSNQANITELD